MAVRRVRRVARRKTTAVRRYRRRRFIRRYGNRFPMVRTGIHYFKRSLTWGQDTVVSGAFTWGNPSNNGGIVSTASYVTFNISAGSTPGNMSSIGFQYTPRLDNLPNLGEFTSLFDAYQIRKVVFKLYPVSTVSTNYGAGSLGDISLFLHTVIDHDSNVIPAAGEAGIDTLKQYPSYRSVRMLSSDRRPIRIVLKPRYQVTVHSSAGSADASEGKRSSWLDLSFTNIPHYGLLGVFECISPGAGVFNFPIRCETTYYMKFKGPR